MPTNPYDLTDKTGTATGQIPAAPSLPNLAGQDQKNIQWLLNPSFDTREVFQNAAEKSVAGGTGGSGFALNNKALMLDSEKIARAKLGHDLLNPYLDRSQQQSLQSQAEKARMDQAVLEGNQAMERLKTSEAGMSARLSQEERARLQQLVLQGEQARILANINNTAEAERQRASIGGNLANTALDRLLRTEGGTGGGGGGGVLANRRGVTSGGGTSSDLWAWNATGSDSMPGGMGYVPPGNPLAAGISAPNGGGGSPFDFNNVSQLAQDILRKYTT